MDEDGNLPDDSDGDESGNDGNDQLREVYATKSKSPPPKPNKVIPHHPLIPKELYDPLPVQVKDILQQQHAWY